MKQNSGEKIREDTDMSEDYDINVEPSSNSLQILEETNEKAGGIVEVFSEL